MSKAQHYSTLYLFTISILMSLLGAQSMPATLSHVQIDTGVNQMVNSAIGINLNTAIQYTKPTFTGSWIYLTVTSL